MVFAGLSVLQTQLAEGCARGLSCPMQWQRAPSVSLAAAIATSDTDAHAEMAEQCLSAAEELQLGLSRAFYGVARVLRLTKLRDLLSAARLGPDATVYLLGHRYCCPPHATEAQQEEVGPLALSCEVSKRSTNAAASGARHNTAAAAAAGASPVGCRQHPFCSLLPLRRPWRACCCTSTPFHG